MPSLHGVASSQPAMGVRVVFGALLWLLLFTGLGACEATLQSRALTIDDLPACGVSCISVENEASADIIPAHMSVPDGAG